MRWIVAAAVATALFVGCRGGGESAEPRANETTDGGQAAAGNGSPWGGASDETDADRPRAGTGSVAEQQQVQARLLDEDDESRPEGGDAVGNEQQVAVNEQGESGNGVYEFGQQIEAEEPEQLGIADGELASIEGQNISVRRPDGEVVEMSVVDDALVVMDGAPVDPDQLAGLAEGTPIRAEYSLENGQNIARRIEVPIREGDPGTGQQQGTQPQPAPDDRPAGESGSAPGSSGG